MARIIIIYATTDGHTREICSYLMQVIEEYGHQITLVSINDEKTIDLKSFDKIVIGASIRYGKHHKKVYEFIKNNSILLEKKSSAFFSVNVVARKPEKNQPDTNPYLKKFLTQIAWKPEELAVFAGKIDYQNYKPWDRFMIRLIMWMTKGPTDPKACIDFTNWDQVKEFGQTINEM
ncbi:MAG: menaquinone-dependent protoporphyrinogen IX dehydrogenase [Gammaproteobacteria bacterium]|nr:menaquinone-dependent protoporphyrinogen IX dehydrogenase [Gammaproteobacteria bacterium]